MKIGRGKKAEVSALITVLLLALSDPTARAQYAGTILYQLSAPAGYTGVPDPFGGDDTGQIVGAIDSLNPAYVYWSIGSSAMTLSFDAWSVSGNQFAGIGPGRHAYVQNGLSGPGTDLNPSGMVSSRAYYTDGAQQVGGAAPSSSATLDPFVSGIGAYAYVWNGSATSAVNLNPTGFYASFALGTDGVNQVGVGALNTGAPPTQAPEHALLWSGSSSTYIDLNPSAFTGSIAIAVSGNDEVGYGTLVLNGGMLDRHALLWNGSASAYIDLNPNGFFSSQAMVTNGTEQAGIGDVTSTSSGTDALFWDGTAASAINLQSLLPASDTWASSYPLGIDASGDVFGNAEDTSGNYYAVEWSPVPEPSLCGVMALAGIGLMGGRRGKRSV